jgi:CheY-like chemotaxis protein
MAKILVAEDDELNWDLISRFLRRCGHEVTRARSGTEAVAGAGAGTPDLILMDLGLPEMDGWEATRRIKAEPSTHKIPIIVLTAHATTSDVEKAVRAGCDHYETKPLRYQHLLAKIEGILSAPLTPDRSA